MYLYFKIRGVRYQTQLSCCYNQVTVLYNVTIVCQAALVFVSNVGKQPHSGSCWHPPCTVPTSDSPRWPGYASGNIRDWRQLHRYCIQYASFQDGSNLNISAISMPDTTSRYRSIHKLMTSHRTPRHGTFLYINWWRHIGHHVTVPFFT